MIVQVFDGLCELVFRNNLTPPKECVEVNARNMEVLVSDDGVAYRDN